MAKDIRNVKNITDLISYFSQNLGWDVDIDDFDDIEDISYDFDAADIGLKEESFAKISSLRQLQPLVDGQQWGIFCVEFDSNKFEPSALKKILSGLIPRKRNSADHAVWCQQDLLFICNWGTDNDSTIGLAHFEDREGGLPQIKMFSCAPALEDFTQIKLFEERLAQLSWPKNASKIDEWREVWSGAFTMAYKQTIQDSSTLTVQLAAEAQNIRNRILDILEVETKNGYVHKLFEKFRDTLIQDMTEQQFADMYAQTVVYGLFSARCLDETQEDFSVEEAIELLPNTNPFLKSLMQECFGANSKSKLSFDELEVGNVIDLLKHTKTDAIIQDFNRQTGGGKEDPVIHFYEEFLTAYDKAQKVQRGVFYTPQPVVNFIVRAVDSILKTEFGYEDGLATEATKTVKYERNSKKKVDGYYKKVEDAKEVPAIQILDPATGTGTFLRQTILQIYENFQEKHKGQPKEKTTKEWIEYVDRILLPRLNGFELMMAPYAVAHMKLAMVLKDTGYDFSGNHRLNVFLTNSLEEAGRSDGQMTLWDDPLATESIEANEAKKNNGLNIIIGNPPYSTESSNKGLWINSLMDSYKKEADLVHKLIEKNSKPLNDDYIKFIRYGQNYIEQSEQALLAFINPHGFLDGPIYRGMRAALMKCCSSIYLLDLHGNTNRQESAPDGSKDENVFDIKQGVCIVFLIKENDKKSCRVYRGDVWGTREQKYEYLQNKSFSNVTWKELHPEAPNMNFFIEDKKTQSEYSDGFSVKDLFLINGTGVLTKRDELCIHFTKQGALGAANDILTMPQENVKQKYHIPEDVRDWKYEWAKNDVLEHGVLVERILPITYRPYDYRFVYYTGLSRGFLGWPVHNVMQHMINTDNIALVTARSNKAGNCTHFFVSENIVEYKCGERTTNSSVFPLYLKEDGFLNKRPNYNTEIIEQFARSIGGKYVLENNDAENAFTPINVFEYIYAVLYSNKFREKYAEFLNRDFPIIPYPKNYTYFKKLCLLGAELISTQLRKKYEAVIDVSLIGADRTIQNISYSEKKVFINKTTYFEVIEDDEWGHIVGGYQPAQRWLKERRGRELSDAEICEYGEIINIIKKTRTLMSKIDEII